MSDKQPFWGPNAKPIFIQLVVGLAVGYVVYKATRGWLPELTSKWAHDLLDGALICEYFTC